MRVKFAAQGGAGSKFRSQQEKLIKTLTLPKGAKEELGITGDEGMPPAEESKTEQQREEEEDDENDDEREKRVKREFEARMLRELYGEGRYHLIPSFWRTIMYLKKQKKEFAIAFRTFG